MDDIDWSQTHEGSTAKNFGNAATICFADRNVMTRREPKSFHQRSLSSWPVSSINSEKAIKEQVETNYVALDLECYENILREEEHFGADYCRQEMRCFKDWLSSPQLGLGEKLRVFSAIGILHRTVEELICRDYSIQVEKKDLAGFMRQENINRSKNEKKAKTERAGRGAAQALIVYEVVPQHLVSIFNSIEGKGYEEMIIKGRICEVLGDVGCLAVIEFLRNVKDDDRENNYVKDAAGRSCWRLEEKLQKGEDTVRRDGRVQMWTGAKRSVGALYVNEEVEVEYRPGRKLGNVMLKELNGERD